MCGMLAACEGDPVSDVRPAPEYFPLVCGAYQIYDVKVINHSASPAPEELHYELLTQVTDSFPSGDNQYTYIIHRSTRHEGAAWESLDTWSARKEGSAVIVNESNIPYMKLKLPYSFGNRWDGNVLNTLGEDVYAYRKIGGSGVVNGISFENTVEVEQEDNQDPIVFRDARTEVYAAGAGLVYKEVIQLFYCTDESCLGQQKVDHGIEMKMVILEYGKK